MTATANDMTGSYTVDASIAGAASMAPFVLTNLPGEPGDRIFADGFDGSVPTGPVWIAGYDGHHDRDDANAIALDAAGNVYVAGWSVVTTGDNQYATVKYAADGTQQWVATFDDPAGRWDEGYALAVDDAGNSWVTGRSYGNGFRAVTIKYDASGAEQWMQCHAVAGISKSIGIDASGNAFVAGGSSDYRIVKFGADGGVQWAATAGGEGGAVTVLRADADGSVVSGGVIGCDGGPCFAVVRHDAAGNEVWRALHDPGYATSDAVVYDLAIDARGDIAAIGLVSIAPATLLTGYLTVKYTSAGTPLWSERYDGGITGFHGASALAMDDAGRIYVTGYAVSDAAGGSRDFTTIRYGNPD